jgi:signal transduction histidine kinase
MELGVRVNQAGANPRERGASLAGRLAWITGLRLGFMLLALGATATLYLHGELARYAFSMRIVFATITAGFAQAAAYGVVLRSGKRLQELAWVQIVLDQVTWTAVVYVSGGATSGATSFYALTCLVGAVLVGRRGAAAAAALGVGAYGLLCLAFERGWIVPPPDQPYQAYFHAPGELVYPLLVNLLGVSVVATLGGYLAERLRVTGGALQAANIRAFEAERLAMLGRIAAGLAHEIRNPLGSISGSIEILRESPGLSADDRRLCDIIHREARHLNDLVGDMVDLSRPRPPQPAATDVAAIARDVVELASHAERGSDVHVRYEGPEGAVLARCDGPQMRQVVWNLVRNAIQASSAGSTVMVRVATEDEAAARKGYVTLAVDDQGPGVPDGMATRIFDDFFTTRTHGAGIGLAVVKRIVDDHEALGVKLSVGRAEGGGASFRVRLSREVSGLPSSPQPPKQG